MTVKFHGIHAKRLSIVRERRCARPTAIILLASRLYAALRRPTLRPGVAVICEIVIVSQGSSVALMPARPTRRASDSVFRMRITCPFVDAIGFKNIPGMQPLRAYDPE